MAEGLGLSQYEGVFLENEVEADILPDLTESDLEKTGLPLGPGKRLLKNRGEAGGSPIATSSHFRPLCAPTAQARLFDNLGDCASQRNELRSTWEGPSGLPRRQGAPSLAMQSAFDEFDKRSAAAIANGIWGFPL